MCLIQTIREKGNVILKYLERYSKWRKKVLDNLK